MKKAISFVLVIALVLVSCGVVYAATSTSKISADADRKIKETPDGEKIEVVVRLNVQVPSTAELDDLTRKELGEEWWRENWGVNPSIEAVHEYRAVYNRIAKEYETAANQAFVQKSGISEEDIVYISTIAPMVLLKANAQTIYRLAEMTEVESISYQGYQQSGNPTTPPTDNSFPKPTEAPTGIQPTYQTIHPTETDEQYQRRFTNLCSRRGLVVKDFDVLYMHTDSMGNNDWTLVYGTTESTIENEQYAMVGNRIIVQTKSEQPFVTGYAVLNMSGSFIDITKARFTSFSGLEETFNRIGGGRLLGDIDKDNELTVIDITMLQRCDVKMSSYPEDDNINLSTFVEGALTYYSDFNRDGERSILDATCIQRYLAGMTYPVG